MSHRTAHSARRLSGLSRSTVIGLILLVFSLPFAAEARETPAAARALVIGHRGAAGLAPENTLAGFRRALEIGVDAIELDVLLTADGELVVLHDFRLKPEITRTPEGAWLGEPGPAVLEVRLAELKSFDVGRLKPGTGYAKRFPDQQAVDGQRIPTLREVIGLLKEQKAVDTELWIEIKTTPEDPTTSPRPEIIAAAVTGLLRGESPAPRVRILAFDWRALQHVQAIAPEILTVYLTTPNRHLDRVVEGGSFAPSAWTAGLVFDQHGNSVARTIKAAGGCCWAARRDQVNSRAVQEARDLGLKVFVWTVNDAGEMRRLLDLGVDGIITDRPDLLKTILGR